jgi:hypothetical protein
MPETAPRKFHKFNDLMPHRVREVLLVSSLYDAFIMQEEGHLTEQIFLEYKDLNLSSAPRFTHATTVEEALKALEVRRFDIVLAMHRVGGLDLQALGRRVKEMRPGKPVVVLAFDHAEIEHLTNLVSPDCIDAVFMWNGDAKILLAIIKHIEDKQNVDHDIAVADIRVILVVEDSVRFYSSFLAALYPELMKQSNSLFAEGSNRLQKLVRMRTRPKILHATSYEQALELVERYRDNLLAVISDIGFRRAGRHDETAGLRLAHIIRKCSADIPILLQSFEHKYEEAARTEGVLFLDKHSPSLLHEIRRFLSDYLGFGEFVFRLPDGREVARARDVFELEKAIATVPPESLEYHTSRNHVSNWLMARSEFELAIKLRPKSVEDFPTVEDVRQYLLRELRLLRKVGSRGVITDFSREEFDPDALFQRLGQGSIGGKARGLAFLNTLLIEEPHFSRLGGMPVRVPQSFTIATDYFDRFMDENDLAEFAYQSNDDGEITRRFFEASLPGQLVSDLGVVVSHVHSPLAVRSSSLLEDDMIHPFAGIYRTIMIPNNGEDRRARLENLCHAIKLVYASTFYRNAKAYVENTAHRVEEEKMAVVVQRLVGREFGRRFYPQLAGVAHSYNYYPLGPQKPEDGVVQLALGLGRIVVDGGQTLRFCPRYPQVLPQFATPELVLKNSQRAFYALDLDSGAVTPEFNLGVNLKLHELPDALADGVLPLLGSVYDPHDNIITDSPYAQGTWVVTFNNLLKHHSLPLADALIELLRLGEQGLGTAVELEFAVDLGDYGRRDLLPASHREPTLYALQLRPIVTQISQTDEHLNGFDPAALVCRSTQALGQGRFEDLADVVYVKNAAFDPARNPQIARQVGQFNEQLRREGRHYVLIGPGRWGSADHWLGIPVQWSQISGARLIIEASPSGYNVDPSQGSHFFHNITSLRIGYFTVPPGGHPEDRSQGDFVDWAWLDAQPAVQETEYLRHVRLASPLTAMVDGRKGLGVIARTTPAAEVVVETTNAAVTK